MWVGIHGKDMTEYGRCEFCLQAMPESMHVSSFPMSDCPGRPPALRKLLSGGATMGHHLQRCDTEDGTPLFACVSCGAWAIHKCINLLLRCPGQAVSGTAGSHAFRRIQSGRHPDYHGHRNGRLSSAWRHMAIEEGAFQGPGSSYLTMQPREGSRLAALRDRIRAKEVASAAAATPVVDAQGAEDSEEGSGHPVLRS
jgi:hypothetical protein